MTRPRWQEVKTNNNITLWRCWDQAIAVLTAINLSWIIFDISYIPLRAFWINRNFHPLPSTSIVIPLKWLPDITSYYDSFKGIKADTKSQTYLRNFKQLDQIIALEQIDTAKGEENRSSNLKLIQEIINNDVSIEIKDMIKVRKIRSLLRDKAGKDSANEAASYLLSKNYLKELDWNIERQFWNKEIAPLIETNYLKIQNQNNQYLNSPWKLDLAFQALFLFDIIVRLIRLKFYSPKTNWQKALLMTSIDIPLLLPFWKPLRIFPTIKRLSSAKLIHLEPLREIISEAIVAFFAIEVFEAITERILFSFKKLIYSPKLPNNIRNLCSYNSIERKKKNQIIELARLWLPLFSNQIGPKIRPQFVELFRHALQKSLQSSTLPSSLKKLDLVEKAESALSYQLATGMTDAMIDLSRNAGDKILQKDILFDELGVDFLDSFLEELASILENEKVSQRSQELLISFLNEFKDSSIKQLKANNKLNDLTNNQN